MPSVRRAALPSFVALACAAVVASAQDPPRAAAPLPAPLRQRADSLVRAGVTRDDLGSVEGRRRALTDLQRAVEIDSSRAGPWFELGRMWLAAHYRDRARECLDRAARLAPDDPRTRRTLGDTWKQDWLASMDSLSLARAIRSYARAVELAPGDLHSAFELAALLLASGRPAAADDVASYVLDRDPSRGDAMLLMGAAAWRAGEMARADSLFESARTRLEKPLARRFNDERWLFGDALSARGGYRSGARSALQEYWRANDPDLTTPENEAKLDFESRVALALALFRDSDGLRWDERAELVARYGLPAFVAVDPADEALEYAYPRRTVVPYAPDPLPYAYRAQRWAYPDLGMSIELWDMALTGHFRPAISTEHDEPTPDASVLANRDDIVLLDGGRSVFRAMPPGARALPVRGQVARFPSATGAARLVAHLETPGTPADVLVGACAISTPEGRVIARDSCALAISACDPASTKLAEYTIDVPPGEYRVDLTVHGAHGGRGRLRRDVVVPSDPGRLAISDLVLLCDAPPAIGATRVRLDPNLAAHVRGEAPLSAYFELEHLRPGRDGESRFEITYDVQPQKPRRGASAEATTVRAGREERFVGTLRRQYLLVPVARLLPGAYVLTVDVHDLVGGDAVRQRATFVRE